MTYILYVDGGGNSTTPTYFSYELWQDDKKAGPIVYKGLSQRIECHRFLCRNIPKSELPFNCSIVDNRGVETSNLSEIIAYFYSIKRVRDVSGFMPLTVRQDSRLIVNFVNGLWQCKKAHLIPWLKAINSIKWPEIKTEWVSREMIFKVLGH